MTGDELQRYLEASYDRWIRTWTKAGDHILNIVPKDNARTQQRGWSFAGLSYNFDSVAGLNYTVDVTRARGSRVEIASLADGSAFDPSASYPVALTSYRASGGGNLLDEIGIDTDHIDQRVLARYPEIRTLLYDYLKTHPVLDPAQLENPALLGHWAFVPERIAAPVLTADLELLFGKK